MSSLFRHERIVENTPGVHNDVCLLTDLTGNGWLDIIIGGKYGKGNLCWYEAPDWTCHTISSAYLEAGGVLLDVNQNGRLDIIAGEAAGNGSKRPGGGQELYWFEQPADPRMPWKRHVIENGLHKYHDQAIGDVDGDGKPEIIAPSQFAGLVAYYDVPDSLQVKRWPLSCRHIVAPGLAEEGVAVADISGSGQNVIFAGTGYLETSGDVDAPWVYHRLGDYDRPAIAVGDLTGDGLPELVASEGESYPARLGWFDPRIGQEHLLADDLYHPHSLEIGDINGNGQPDIFCGEMGLGEWDNPRLFVWINHGHGEFERVVISEGIPTHNATLGDVNGNGRLDVVGKPYNPGACVDIWWNEWTEREN